MKYLTQYLMFVFNFISVVYRYSSYVLKTLLELMLRIGPFLVKQNFKDLVIKCLGKFDKAWQK